MDVHVLCMQNYIIHEHKSFVKVYTKTSAHKQTGCHKQYCDLCIEDTVGLLNTTVNSTLGNSYIKQV